MKNKVLLISLALVLLVSLLVCSCAKSAPTPAPSPAAPAPAAPAPAKVYEWKAQSLFPSTGEREWTSQTKLCEMIGKNTNGRVKITLLPMGSVVQTPELMNAVRDGVLDMCITDCGYHAGSIPALNVLGGLPLSYESPRQAAEILYDYGLSELPRQAYTTYGVQPLGHHIAGGEGFGLLTRKSAQKLDDIKGLKIRAHGSFLEYWKRLGAATVSLPFAEIYTALATGTIDGVATAWAGHVNNKIYELCKYGLLPSYNCGSVEAVLVNPKTWNSLPQDVQTIVTLTYADYAQWEWRYFQSPSQLKDLQELKNRGVQFTTLSEADQAKMFEVAAKQWDEMSAADALAGKAVTLVKDYYKAIGRLK